MRSHKLRRFWASALLLTTLGLAFHAQGASTSPPPSTPQASNSERVSLDPERQSRALVGILQEGAGLIAEARRHADSPLALAPLLELSDLLDWLPEAPALGLAKLAKDAVTRGDGGAYAAYLYLRLLSETGRFDEARAEERRQGFVEGWLLAGPFPNDGMSGFSTAYPPESEGFQGADQRFEGRMVEVGWLPTERATESGYHELAEWISPVTSSVVYGLVECRFNATALTMDAAVDGAYRLWVNGAPAAENERHLGGMLLRDQAPIRVRSGWNQILLKVATEDHAGGWHLRFLNDRGESALRDCRAPSASIASVREGDFPQVQTLNDRLQARSSSFSANEYADAATIVRSFHSADASEPWEEYADRVDRGAASAQHLARVGRVFRERWRTMDFLREAWTKDPSPAIGSEAVFTRNAEMGWSSTEEIRPWIEQLSQTYGDDLRIQVGQLRLLLYLGMSVEASLQYKNLLAIIGSTPNLCAFARDALRSVPDAEGLRAASDLCEERRASGLGTLRASMARDLQLGRLDALQEKLDRYDEHFAHRSAWHWLKGDILASRSDDDKDAAEKAYARAHELLPGDATLALARAQNAIRSGDEAKATELLDLALALQPQNRLARDLRQFLAQSADRFYTSWRTSRSELVELRDGLDVSEHDYGRLVDTRVIRVHPNGLSTRYIQRAWTVATRSGADDLRAFSVAFSPDSELVDILSVQILRPDGSVRESFSSREVKPYSGPSSIYYDVRYRQLTFPQLEAGDILSVEYTVSDVAFRNIFDDYFGDIWFFQGYEPLAQGRFVVEAPAARAIYHHVTSDRVRAETTALEETTRHLFEVRDVPALTRATSLPGPSEAFGFVHVSTYKEWDDLARWYWNLIREQLVTSPEILAAVHSLTDGVSDVRERVARIYTHVVRTIRYVGLEFGVHGFKPYRTTQCYSLRLGDCKDSASLIKVMLNAAGIDAHVVLIRTRDRGRLPESPPSLAVFNHAIVYVPALDLYLDGTTPYSGLDDLVGADQGASALIILDGEGGRFVTTPYLDASLNETKTTVQFDARANAGEFYASYTGQTASSMRRSFETEERRMDAINRWIANMVPGTQTTALEFSDVSRNDIPVEFTAKFEGGRWVQPRGEELLVLPFGREVLRVGDRASSSRREILAEVGVPERVIHTMRLVMPEGSRPALRYASEPTRVESEFGFVELRVSFDEASGVLSTEAVYERHATRVSPDDWGRYREWTRSVERLANEPFVFTRGGGIQ